MAVSKPSPRPAGRTKPAAAGTRRPSPASDRRGAALALEVWGSDGTISADAVADAFGLSKGQLAETIGVSPETLQRVKRAAAARTQARLRDVVEIVARVSDWAGGDKQALAWFRAEPLPAFAGRTAEALVKEGRAAAVRDYLDHLALGGFA